MVIKISDKPMMSDEEIRIIDDIIFNRQPKNCLEWGSGISTVYFPGEHPSIKLWLAVEHNGHYLNHIRYMCPPNVQTLWVLPGSSYADVVQRSNREFDFIFIDGLDRIKCLENALRIVSKKGIILLHDAGRKEFSGVIDKYKGKMLSKGEIKVDDGGYAHRGLAMFERL